eukprot:11222671-Lingulodinium_polyedra.AAC.1
MSLVAICGGRAGEARAHLPPQRQHGSQVRCARNIGAPPRAAVLPRVGRPAAPPAFLFPTVWDRK